MVVNKLLPEGYHNSVSLRQKKGQYSLLRLIPDQDCTGSLTLGQIHKLHPEEWYTDCRIVLFESSQSGPIFLQEEEGSEKKITMEVELSNDTEYLLLIEMNWSNKDYETVLSTLTSSRLELVKQRYSPSNDHLLTLKKPRATDRLKPDQTTANKSNSSER